jgi:hypothetical protein
MPKIVNNLPANLICAHCGEEYLHQREVEVFRRDKEGSGTGFHVIASKFDILIASSQDGNPSDERDGIRMIFDCEMCDYQTILTIAQHEGFELVKTKARRK